MTIVSFVEGAHVGRGGTGIVGVPTILRSLAARGHRVALIMGGPVNPGREEFAVPNVTSALERKEGTGAFGIVTFAALPRWSFAPTILPQLRRHVRDADLVTLHSLNSFPVLAGFSLARLYRRPYAVWPHGVLAPFQRGVSRRKKWLYDSLFVRRILDNASVVFYSSGTEREEVQDLGQHSPSVVIPDGMIVDDYSNLPPRGRFRAKYLGGHAGELIVFLARVNVKKGLDLLIKSMSLVLADRPQARLAIVGPAHPPSFGNRVLEWIRESGIQSRTVMPGMISHDEKLELLADADLLVLPSEVENFGHSMFEAMASGVPVIVSDTLHFAPQMAQAGAGVAVRREPAQFANCVARLLADPLLRHKMGTCGKRFVRAYSWEETGRQVELTLESVLEHRPLPSNLFPVAKSGASTASNKMGIAVPPSG
jgi:glycosyltransferase involved in cell wall biosynthesis